MTASDVSSLKLAAFCGNFRLVSLVFRVCAKRLRLRGKTGLFCGFVRLQAVADAKLQEICGQDEPPRDATAERLICQRRDEGAVRGGRSKAARLLP